MNLKLEELQVYQLAMEIAERIWNIVIKWDYFAKDVIGKQLMKAVDSMAANLSEGYGRFLLLFSHRDHRGHRGRFGGIHHFVESI